MFTPWEKFFASRLVKEGFEIGTRACIIAWTLMECRGAPRSYTRTSAYRGQRIDIWILFESVISIFLYQMSVNRFVVWALKQRGGEVEHDFSKSEKTRGGEVGRGGEVESNTPDVTLVQHLLKPIRNINRTNSRTIWTSTCEDIGHIAKSPWKPPPKKNPRLL